MNQTGIAFDIGQNKTGGQEILIKRNELTRLLSH